MFTFEEIAGWTSNDWKNICAATQLLPIIGISHDTRTLNAGEVYIAITGENHDGHDFVEQAVEKGASGLIVEREFPNIGIPQLVVSDARKALWQMAAGVRAAWRGTVVGITGSAGKTTVKELTASVLAQKGTVAKTPGNWNNDIGLPLGMLAADRNADFFVFEIGMNHPGEIGPLAGLLCPDWAMITNIGKAHIEFFQPTASGHISVQDAVGRIADEKAAILKHAKHAVLDADSKWFERLKTGFEGRVVRLTDLPLRAPQPGEYMIHNCRFAATVGEQLGLSAEQIQSGLDAFENAPMRWQTVEKDGVVFVNDAYNANPLSMRAALETFAEMDGRKFVVLGGMRELGGSSEQEHRDIRSFADSLGFDGVLTVGDAWETGIEKSTAVQLLREVLRAGDKVLLKASRAERLETILTDLEMD